ncbi:T9SS type A sorting domain-containing protein [uncultured Draconibacterium sp.]|uniref:T9SS type A sorting domain-containing protein n=1 Tax=uncultured Draconibacterium sp. TaxID=1573823 RepID=UPI0032608F68
MKFKYLLFLLFVNSIVHAQDPEYHVVSSDPEIRAIIKKGMELMKDNSIKNNRILALSEFNEAANLGSATAQFIVAEMYEKGLGTKKDKLKAFEWYNLSAENGDMHAMYKVGLIYKEGKIVPQNFETAVEWFQRSVDAGNPAGNYFLAYMYFKGFGVKQNYITAFELAQLSSDADITAGKHLLAYCYENGHGTKADLDKAEKLYIECDKRGYKQSKVRLEEVKKKKQTEANKKNKSAQISNNSSYQIPIALQGFFDLKADDKRPAMQIGGKWQGMLFIYDWSKQKNEEQMILNLTLNQDGYNVNGNWNLESSSKLPFNSIKVGNSLFFKNLELEFEWAYGQPEKWSIKEGQFEYQVIDDEIFLIGDLKLSNPNINEPFRPCNIVLKAVNIENNQDTVLNKDIFAVELNNIVKENDKNRKIQLSVYPNPTSSNITIQYNVLEPGSVQLNLIDINGQLIKTIENDTYKMIGKYSTATSISEKPGSYFIQLVHNNQVYSSAIIKQ